MKSRHIFSLWQYASTLLICLFAILVPGPASSQSICEGLTTILTSESADLEFHSVPGAICKTRTGFDRRGSSSFGCIWPKPGPPGSGAALRQWLNTAIMPDMKKLAGAIQQCIKRNEIPGKWRSFRKDRTSSGRMKGYFVQRSDSSEHPQTIGICFEYNNDDFGAGIVLTVRSSPKGKSYCSNFW